MMWQSLFGRFFPSPASHLEAPYSAVNLGSFESNPQCETLPHRMRWFFLFIWTFCSLVFTATSVFAQGETLNPTSTADGVSVNVTWNDSGHVYSWYMSRINGSVWVRTDTIGVSFNDVTYGLGPGNAYTVEVQGCSPNVAPGNVNTGCSTPEPTSGTIPLPAPQNVAATATLSAVTLTWINPDGSTFGLVAQSVSRVPKLPNNSGTSLAINQIFVDPNVTPNTTYSYTVCLTYGPNETSCAPSLSVTTPAPPPQCQITEDAGCPVGGGNQNYHVTCSNTATFYIGVDQQSTGTSFTGPELSNNLLTTINACAPSASGPPNQSCTSLATTSTMSCPINPVHPHPPITSCKVCLRNGQGCKPVPGGFVCTGNLN